jgi:hypothetical protein
MQQNSERQTAYFSETQHKFMKTTDEQGGVVDNDEEDPQATRSMYRAMREATQLCSCRCFPCLRPPEENPDDELDEQEGQASVDSNRVKKVMPNNNQDTWLKYIVMNLAEMDDIKWVQDLAANIDKNTDSFNAGKFRGDIFYLRFMQRENEVFSNSMSVKKKVIDTRIQRPSEHQTTRMSMATKEARQLGQQFAELTIAKQYMNTTNSIVMDNSVM